MIAPPTGDFANVLPQDVAVSLQYFGAMVEAIPASQLVPEVTRRTVMSLPARRAHQVGKKEKREAMVPRMVQAYAFVGQINKERMVPGMNT